MPRTMSQREFKRQYQAAKAEYGDDLVCMTACGPRVRIAPGKRYVSADGRHFRVTGRKLAESMVYEAQLFAPDSEEFLGGPIQPAELGLYWEGDRIASKSADTGGYFYHYPAWGGG